MKSERSPQSVAVVGAGMVGLCTAWFLQEQGVEVTVIDREGVAAGSSRGNAGWLTPSLAAPLPDPAVLKYGLKALLSPTSPVYVPPTVDPQLVGFLVGFARRSTKRHWQSAMGALIPLNDDALAAFDEMANGGVREPTTRTDSFVAAFGSEADREPLLQEVEHIRGAGQEVSYDVLDGEEARSLEPALSGQVGAALRLNGQRFINPGAYVQSLADAFVVRGGHLIVGDEVTGIIDDGAGVQLSGRRFDRAVIATGAWLGTLARQFGVRRVVQSGRGYSFSVAVSEPLRGPIYLPVQRVACTPIGERLRVAGMMEFCSPDARFDPRRIKAIVEAARPFLRTASLDARVEEWVGARPCTADGLGLIGRTASPRVYVAGGHGMWGMTLGPITGKLLAHQVITGEHSPALAPFDPLR